MTTDSISGTGPDGVPPAVVVPPADVVAEPVAVVDVPGEDDTDGDDPPMVEAFAVAAGSFPLVGFRSEPAEVHPVSRTDAMAKPATTRPDGYLPDFLDSNRPIPPTITP